VTTEDVGAPQRPIDILLDNVSRALAAAEAEIRANAEKVQELAEQAAREQAELQRHLEEFTLERNVFLQADSHREEETGPLLDVAAMRAGAAELNAELGRTQTVHNNIAWALSLVQLGAKHLSGEQAFVSLQETGDLRLQLAMTEAREEERSRLAREIHDGPAQVLTNAIYGIQIAEQIARRSPDLVVAELIRLRDLLKGGVAEMRRFMSDLRPTMLQDYGLAPTLKHYVDEYNRFFEKQITFSSADAPLPLSPQQELALFRIVQEALQNIHKHAGANANAEIDVQVDDGELVLSIHDDGPGFDPSAVGPRITSGAGLPGMRERARLVGAELQVVSAPGEGTTLIVRLPLRSPTVDHEAANLHLQTNLRDHEGAR
jgi:two-component system sensor histidine kinase DegS